ncbi:MAG TPA: alkaline phosphatase family protein [Candidatus Polarisedimenticolaceae bacterium]|nr:alkaline phosphatase family protein [Candidatus Polarisedimenticolaceae bacterium]
MIRRATRILAVLALAASLWAACGVRVLDPRSEFGVWTIGGGGTARAAASHLTWAAPGTARFTRWPRSAVTLPLPGPELGLTAASGERFGLTGTATLRALPERAQALAAGPGRLDDILAAAVRAGAPVLDEAAGRRTATPAVEGLFERSLRDALDERGVALEELRWSGMDYARARNPVAPVPEDARVLVVGLDGADWEIVDPLIAAGRMPHLAHLIEQGVRAKLLSISPMLSPVVWTTIATGVEPRIHGVMDFLAPTAAGTSEPVTSAARKVPAVWDLLSEAGVPVAVTGWWATWPAASVRGAMVTDRVAYQLFGFDANARSAEGKTWPPELYDEVRKRIVTPSDVPWSDVRVYLDGLRTAPEQFDADERARLDDFRTVLASGRTYLDVALALRSRTPAARFEAVYFEGTDTVGHLFMPYRDPRLTGVDPRRFASFHAVVDRYYETADRQLGRLLEGRDDWTVIVCSDHGFASDDTRPRTTDSRIGHGAAADWHRRFGILVVRGPSVRRGAKIDEVSVYDLAPTVLALFGQPVPISWPGRVLAAAMEPSWLAAHPTELRDDPPPLAPSAPGGGGDEARELREKLQSLGYLAGTTPAPMTTENNRGVAFLGDGRYAEAAEAFRKAIADEPNQPTLWVNLGIALRFSGHADEARTWLERAAATAEGERAAGHQLAQLELESGELASAERRLRAVLAREPGASEVRNSLGIVLEREGRLDEARAAYESAARSDANAAEPRNNLGNLAKLARHGDEAERWYLAAIDADPYFMGAYNNLALLYQDRGQTSRAIDLYDRALAKSPSSAVVLNNLASLYYATGDARAAATTWERAAAADPGYASPLNNLAGLALAENRDADADALLSRALAIDPGYGDAHINRALLARKRGDVAKARTELEAATADPKSAGPARLQRGLLELQEGHPGLALQALEQAERTLGDSTEILNALGEAHARLGDRDAALDAWQRSLTVDAKQPAIIHAIEEIKKQ